ncbi:MAG: malonic semialdehyde reductase [Caulobacterales bacterium]|nr:malonic semialdehyde reductase [Caulobacterales bacterium]
MAALPDPALDQLFRSARTYNSWDPAPLPESLLREIYELAKWGPTAANSTPARFVFVTSEEGRARLAACAHGYNRDKILQAPCTVVVGYDLDFPEHLPRLFPHNPSVKDDFPDPDHRRTVALRNGSLQGGYFIMAARSLGLDCGPMGGFEHDEVDAAFFAGTNIKSNFICSIGYGGQFKLRARGPRLDFEEACKIV